MYGIQVIALHEIRWPRRGQLKLGRKYVMYFSSIEKRHSFGCGIAVYETLKPYLKEFNPISERINLLRVNMKSLNIILICVHASTETGEDKRYFP